MKNILPVLFATVVLLGFPLCSDAQERANFEFFLDAGFPVPGSGGNSSPEFTGPLLDLAAQARLGGKVYIECIFGKYPASGEYAQAFHDFDFELNVVRKFSPRRKSCPFLKLGLILASIGPDAFMGANAGAGIERRSGRKLLLRLGGSIVLTLDRDDAFFVSWWKLFAGVGLVL